MTYETKQIDWKGWIDDRNERRKQEYTSEPGRLISDYNREQSGTKGYFGRILLEMLQNADDAGLDQTEPVEILIRQAGDQLHIANTGAPFDESGIESLIISDNSPKQFRSDSIGYKGLGFRSVLNWTSSVAILSGDLSIGFSDLFAKEFLANIRKESNKLDTKVTKLENNGISNPIATLSVPKLIDSEAITDPNLKESYKIGKQLRKDGYDTVICIPLDNQEEEESIQKEIDKLYPEIILFLQNISEVRIDTPTYTDVWERTPNNNQETVTVNSENRPSTTWNITEEKGTLPDRLVDRGPQKKKYEIKVAVPIDGDLQEATKRNLSVFFPTKVSFPFPVLAHGTFEVTDDRNHLLTTPVNQFVTEQLADVMVGAIDDLRLVHEDPWLPLKIISAERRVDKNLNDLSPGGDMAAFEALLRSKIEHMPIVPIQGGGLKTPSDVYCIPTDLNNLLNSQAFGDVALYPSNKKLRDQLEALGVKELDIDEFCDRLNQISPNLSTEDRTEIIYRLISEDIVESESIPNLLLDGDGNIISADSKAFIPPRGEQITLPDWVPQQILDDNLVSMLQERFELTSNRDLVNALDPLPVNQYNLRRLIESTIAEANRRIESDTENETYWLQQMLQAVWDLRCSTESSITLSDEIKVQLPTRTENSRSADELYIGKEYPGGHLLERLYQPISEECFIADPETLDIGGDIEEFQEFLCWLGVAKRPRIVEIDDPDLEYAEYILEGEGFPVRFSGTTVRSMDEFRRLRSRHRLKGVSTIDRLDDILQKADPHAVIGLLHEMGSEFDTWRRNGDNSAVFEIKPKGKHVPRQLSKMSLPAYPIWTIQNTEWLPVERGGILQPIRCNLSANEINLLPVIGYPALDTEDVLFDRVSMDKLSIKMALQRAGVTQSLEDLSWDVFYEIILELPEIDPNGEVAARLYSLMVSKKGEPDTNQCDKFRECGHMLGKQEGEVDYFPVNELRLAKNGSLPEAIVKKYPTLQINKKSKTPKVEKLFGIKRLSIEDIEITPIESDCHGRNNEFQKEIERLKPSILALRMGTTQETQARDTIRDLEFKLCEFFQATASVDGKNIELELEPGTFLTVNSTVYLVPKPIRTSQLLDDENLVSLIGDVFSTALEINVRKDTYILSMASDREKTFSILSGQDPEVLAKARKLLDVGEGSGRPFDPPELDLNSTKQTDSSSSESREETTTERQGIHDPDKKVDIGSINVDQGEFEIDDKTNIRIRRIEGPPSNSSRQSSYRVADGYRAEDVCMKFEKKAGRVPIKVSQIHGSNSYGCDIISFSSEDRRKEFSERKDPTLIDRYIEVKASISDTGSILLKGNQLEAAKEHEDRFFLYRAYEQTEDGRSYELITLNDPTAVSRAVEPRISINPFRTEQSELYELEIQPDRDSKS